MVIVTASGEQSFVCIPRLEPAGSTSLTVRSKTENKTMYTITPTYAFDSGELTVTWTPTAGNEFILDNKYYFELVEGTSLLWRGLGFCTDQTNLPKFTANDGKFTEYSGNNNDFITI